MVDTLPSPTEPARNLLLGKLLDPRRHFVMDQAPQKKFFEPSPIMRHCLNVFAFMPIKTAATVVVMSADGSMSLPPHLWTTGNVR